MRIKDIHAGVGSDPLSPGDNDSQITIRIDGEALHKGSGVQSLPGRTWDQCVSPMIACRRCLVLSCSPVYNTQNHKQPHTHTTVCTLVLMVYMGVLMLSWLHSMGVLMLSWLHSIWVCSCCHGSNHPIEPLTLALPPHI